MEDENVTTRKVQVNLGDFIMAIILVLVPYCLILMKITGRFSPPGILDGIIIAPVALILTKPLAMFRCWSQGFRANAGNSKKQ